MTNPQGPEARVFATDEGRQKSRRSYVLLLKLTLLPFLMIMGFLSGSLLTDAGAPGEVGLLCSLVLGPLLPWLALRALNRRLRFWFALRPDGLEVGPEKRGWRVPYEQVALVRESYADESVDPYLEVVAGSKSAKVLMSRNDVRACAAALVERCPGAVWVDERGAEHLPAALQGGRDRASEPARRAVGNLAVLRGRYAQATAVIGGLALVCLAGLAAVAAASLGVLPLGADARNGFAVSSTLGAVFFGYFAWKQSQQWRAWGRLCDRFAGPATPAGAGAKGAPRTEG
jgi:hypothetical protein